MLPDELIGPGTVIYNNEDSSFVERNAILFPSLDKDFISQICYEHADTFNCNYPEFDVTKHETRRRTETAEWIANNVHRKDTEKYEEWAWHVDKYPKGNHGFYVLNHMLKARTWPFPPVVVSADLAKDLGAWHTVGEPFDLVEGTHRISYLVRMLDLGLIHPDSKHELIEIVLQKTS